MTYLKLTDILAINDTVVEKVPVPEWHGTVYLKSMSSIDRDRYESIVLKLKNEPGNMKGWEGLRARVVAASLCDPKGVNLFPPTGNDWRKLNDKSAKVVTRLFEIVMTISGMGAEAEGESEETLSPIPG